jgi:glycosyltransferase involved in cell wall biosynthesis
MQEVLRKGCRISRRTLTRSAWRPGRRANESAAALPATQTLLAMRVVFYTRPALLEPALHFAREMSRLTEFHLVLELEPMAWSALFSSAPSTESAGVVPAGPILRQCFPESLQTYWRDTASFNLVSYRNHRSVHPASLPVSHAAIRFFKDLHPDVLHFDDVSLRLSLNFPELPRIDFLSVHDPAVHSGEQDWRRDLSRRLTFGKVDRFLLHNRSQLEGFCRDFRIDPSRVDVSLLGAYTLLREWMGGPIAEEPCTILFFGRLSKYKGLEPLYRAIQLVAERVDGVRLIVAGSPAFGYQPPPAPVLPRGGQVEVLERYIGTAEMTALMQRASIVVCPYTDATQSGVVLTAYAFGKPVVATDVGGLPEYVRDGESGLVVPANDPAALASAITRILLDETYRRRLSAGVAHVAAHRLSWSTYAANMLALYRAAGRTSPRGRRASRNGRPGDNGPVPTRHR